MLQSFRTDLEKLRQEDDDFNLAKMSDAKRQRCAEQMKKVLDLPADRFQNMERDYQSMIDIARERIEWCRHLVLQQELSRTLSKATAYSIDPNRICVCEKRGYRSIIKNPDWQQIVRAFKSTYCQDCKERDPKNKG